jgi:hypothetical protein
MQFTPRNVSSTCFRLCDPDEKFSQLELRMNVSLPPTLAETFSNAFHGHTGTG